MIKQFKLWNTLCGWIVFAIAAATYLLTMEPTASFWDCGEFISSAAKLDVGHPPGAPFFMLMGHFFSLFASSPEQIAACVNALSALASAFTILFLFWTITALAKKLVAPDSTWRVIGIMAAGTVGALAYTFSDTFWFSAVEGEVYATSSLFTAVVFWLILKWDEHADEEGSDRWLIAIAYLMGLSIGVHLLNLLAIPAIGLVYYFRRYAFKWWSFIVAFLASCAVLLVILYGIIPGFPTVAGWFEWLFVNDFDCPFNTGLAVYIVLVVASLVWAIVETYLDQNKIRTAISFTLAFALSGAAFLFESWIAGLVISVVILMVLVYGRNLIPASVLNTIMVMVAVIIVGYSSYAAIVIRSNAQTPMDQNSPNNVFALKYYLNREQYGDRPLFYGQYYNAPLKKDATGNVKVKEGAPQYAAMPHVDGKPDRYVVTGHKQSYEYQKEFSTIFPRMYSSDSRHVKAYKTWVGMRDLNDVEIEFQGEKLSLQKARQRVKQLYGSEKAQLDKMIRAEVNRLNDENGSRKQDISTRDYYVTNVPYELDEKGNYVYDRKTGLPKTLYNYDFRPTFADNLKFFFDYQVHFMYWRYFMWNFVGRQNDLLSYGDITKGQWISGIPFIDNARLGDQSKLPDELKNNKAHNVYYFLPLLLGIVGIFWQISRKGKNNTNEGARSFTLTFLLFFLTGLAIVMYLNQTPEQPRERDYAYAGSFYAFCIWIGLGALALVDWIGRGLGQLYGLYALKAGKIQDNRIIVPSWLVVGSSALISIACLGVPALMASQNWDDHDRSKRFVCRDFGANYLKSCEPGAILFSNGDNDTFPLWYNQEVEGVGDSIRVCNLSYLQTDWYISQMKRPYYHSDALPISWTYKYYMPSVNEYLHTGSSQEMTVKEAFAYLHAQNDAIEKAKSEKEKNKLKAQLMIPSRNLYVPGPDGEKVKFSQKGAFTRSEMMIMEMISTNQWKRPIYFCSTVGNSSFLGLEPYMELTGLTYQVTPHRSPDGQQRVNSEKMYDNMMHKFKYGNVSADGIYLDENALRMCDTHRSMFAQLAMQLIEEGQYTKAREVLERCEKELPSKNVPHGEYGSYVMVTDYLALQEVSKADEIALTMGRAIAAYANFAADLSAAKRQGLDRNDLSRKTTMFCYICTEYFRHGYTELPKVYAPKVFDLLLAIDDINAATKSLEILIRPCLYERDEEVQLAECECISSILKQFEQYGHKDLAKEYRRYLQSQRLPIQ